MGMFDAYSDLMQTVGDSLQKIDPFGPIGEAGGIVSGLFGSAEMLGENGPDALWNLAGDTAEVASVAMVVLPSARQTEIISAGLKTILGMQTRRPSAEGPTHRVRETTTARALTASTRFQSPWVLRRRMHVGQAKPPMLRRQHTPDAARQTSG